jgi:hypothetical protein
MVSKGKKTWKTLLRNVEDFGPDVDFGNIRYYVKIIHGVNGTKA